MSMSYIQLFYAAVSKRPRPSSIVVRGLLQRVTGEKTVPVHDGDVTVMVIQSNSNRLTA